MAELPKDDIYYFIINHDRFGVLKQQIESLRYHQSDIKLLIIVDHNSSYEPLLKYYEEVKDDPWIRIERAKDEYYGKKNVVDVSLARVGYSNLVKTVKKYHAKYNFRYFAKCDPDCEIPPVKNYFKHMINICQQYDDLWSVGPSLRIDDIPDSYPMKEVNIKNQIKQKFWDSKKKKNISIKDHNYTIYKPSVIDGTLSIFPVTFLPMFHEYFCNFRAIRVAGQYQIRHLDWYISEADEELLNYIQTVGTGSTHSTNWVLGINDLNPSNELFLDGAKKLVHSLNLS